MFYYFQEYTVYKCPFPFEWFSWVSAGRVHVSDLITRLYIEPELCIFHYGMKTLSETILWNFLKFVHFKNLLILSNSP